MASNETNGKPDNFVFTAEALQKTPSSMGMATRAIHADDFLSPHHAIAPAIHATVCYRYSRNPDNLVPKVTDDLNAPFDSHAYARGLDAQL
ncbi:hypothetical protein BKA60DRAFT_601503 [Fusarium oxysporum]|nr:hypothetical protein BKA60DRAFT_601503 [Fusarium oxysporum]KAH7460915.1 hypothetical protein FOMA001_g19423 [Fusarium oxysporum f. sp. matthiolae]